MTPEQLAVKAALQERTDALVRRMDEISPPEPGLEDASLTKMRRTAARLRSGKLRPPAMDITPEELAEALERTVRWREMMNWALAEAADIMRTIEIVCGREETRLLNDCLTVFHEGRRLAKAAGPDSKVAKCVEAMQRAWRVSYGRVPKAKPRKP